jgi:NCAIR mutase (PurE)-related protein
MNEELLKQLLNNIKSGEVSIDEAAQQLKNFTFSELGYAKIDHHRKLRTGYPEVVFGSGKTTEHIVGIVENLMEFDNNILVTRVNDEVYDAVRAVFPNAKYDKLSRAVRIEKKAIEPN